MFLFVCVGRIRAGSVLHGLQVGVLSEEIDDSCGIPSAVEGGLTRRDTDGILAVFVSEDVRFGQITGVLHVASGGSDQFAGELSVEVSAHAAVLGTVGGRDHVGDVVTSVAEVELQHGHLDEVASADFADTEIVDDAVLVGQHVRFAGFDGDHLAVGADFDSVIGGGELHEVTTGVDLDSQWQGFVALLGENGVAGLRRAVGRDQSVAGGGFVVESDVVEGDDGFGSDVAHTDQTRFVGQQFGELDARVAQGVLQVLQDVDAFVVTVHLSGVHVDVGGLIVEFDFHFDVTGIVVLLDGSGSVRGVHVPVRGQTGLDDGVHSVHGFHAQRREVGVADVEGVATRSSVFQDGVHASLVFIIIIIFN